MKRKNIILSGFFGLVLLAGMISFVSAGPLVFPYPKDTTPPVISNVRTMQICGVEFCGPLFVLWDTDEPSFFNRVEYGRGKNYDYSVSQDYYYLNTTRIPTSALAVTLDKSGTYHYKVTSCDMSRNCATSEGYKVKA